MKIFQKIKLFVFAHKIISGIIVIVILFGGYTIYKNSTSTSGETLYTLGTVERGTIISSVDGSGQVSAENQINVTPKVSGTLTYVGVNPGDNVKQGQMLFSLDTTDAEKTVRDAQVSLDNAKLSLQKIQLQDSTENLQTSLDTAYSNSLKDIASTISDSPAILNGLDTILANQNLSDNVVRANGNIGINYRGDAQDTYYKAEMAFQTTRADYASINQNSTPMEIENMLNETLSAEKLLSDAVKSSSTLTDYLSGSTGHPTNYTSLQTSLSG
jgi:multidrug efflux pump subunit AcrA (membrane-fusion protein)